MVKSSTDFRTVTFSRSTFCSCTEIVPATPTTPATIKTTLTVCPGTVTTITWGDGFTSTLGAFTPSINHTYTVADPSVATIFTVTATVTVVSCGQCGSGIVTRTLTTSIKDVPACSKDSHEEPYSKEWSYNNNSYRTETDFFQRGVKTLLYSAKLSIETRLYKRINNKWQKYTAGVLKTGFTGSIFTNDCQAETVVVSAPAEASDDHVYVKHEPNQNFGTHKTGSAEPLGFGTIAAWANTGLQLWKD